ncbi:uncharacterized protein [Aegilops tauschii subsp. strangulata]|uniref:uncharacterized protein isoform X5 n=1 Tax=Aegilops tauschii subsp. strangulata TaxID=200361 RepID=UPI003CC845C2
MREREGRRGGRRREERGEFATKILLRSEDEEKKKNLAEGVKKIKAEVSIMKMSRRVADTESSSNGEAALLEELEDEKILCAPCHIWLGHLQILGSRFLI